MVKIGCKHPLIRIENRGQPYLNQEGKISYKARILKKAEAERYYENLEKEVEGKWTNPLLKIDLIPCGKCIGCRLDNAGQWATRVMLEYLEHTDNYFITFTLEDEYLKYGEAVDKETGQITKALQPTIVKDDFKELNKALRDYYKYHFNHTGIRFFGCQEYGSKNGRPHLHIIYFNLPIPDLKFEGTRTKGGETYNLYSSEIISKIWGKGIVEIQDVTWTNASYVARYTTKKVYETTTAEEYFLNGLEPERINMSRKPGIGMNYYNTHKRKILDEQQYKIDFHGQRKEVATPKAFKRKFKEEYPEEYEKIQEKIKEKMYRTNKIRMSNTTKTINEQLQIEERTLINKTHMLQRNEI